MDIDDYISSSPSLDDALLSTTGATNPVHFRRDGKLYYCGRIWASRQGLWKTHPPGENQPWGTARELDDAVMFLLADDSGWVELEPGSERNPNWPKMHQFQNWKHLRGYR